MTKEKLRKKLDILYFKKLKNPKLKHFPKLIEKDLVKLNDPELVYQYACIVNKKLNSKLEKVLSWDGIYSYLYATQILKDRFKKGEPHIISSPSLGAYFVWLTMNRKKSSFLRDYSFLRKYVYRRKFSTNLSNNKK
jgi:hypothetical protein